MQAYLRLLACVLRVSPAAQRIAVHSMQPPGSEATLPSASKASAEQIR